MDSGGAGVAGKPPLTAEDEVVKRNTDCVYFLASPLTCKKGIECEFRHSEGARLNPRDCRYWLSGNCLNPKCPFRHPPLDGLYGIPGTAGAAPPPPQVAAPGQALVVQTPSYNSNKQIVPCYYFQKGLCLKGDRCPFMHGPQPTGNPLSQPSTKTSTASTDSPQMTKDPWVVKGCTSQGNTLQKNADRPVEVPSSSANRVTKTETTTNGQAVARNFHYHPQEDTRITKFPNHQSENVHPRPQVIKFPNHSSENVHHRAQPTMVPVGSSIDLSRPRNFSSQPATERLKNGRESDPILGRSSAFNVLLDHNAEDSGHFDNNNDQGRKLFQGRTRMDYIDDFSYQHLDPKPAMEFERDQQKSMREYNKHEEISGTHGWDRRTSSERVRDKAYNPERRVMQRKGGAEEMNGSDLRHRLLKQRKLNSSRIAVSPDSHGEHHQRNDHRLQGDRQDYHLQGSISNRLQGRITNPRKSPPDRSIDELFDREGDRRRLQSRLSPSRPISHQGRHHEGIKRRPDEILPSDGRRFGDKPVRTEAADPLDFAGPKSLAELKGAKASESAQGWQPIKRMGATASHEHKGRNLEKVISHSDSEASLSFEGPKPLSTILKRKRKTASENGLTSGSRDEFNQSYPEGVHGNSASMVVLSMQIDPPQHTTSNSGEHEDKMVDNEYEEEEGQICRDSEELIDGQYSAKEIPETEDVMGENIEEQALENSDHRESDNVAAKGAGCKIEDNDDTYQDADDEDLDDEDDFARKVGLMFS
ncbi:hypothetical protein J5N97_018982 [Dioscorea zingiberensis]|uniref:C3H1-type domain-containing protein n=1 Tax=Dioscorea zingiberensis TaxID=325984 RepID=A0A9D5CD39_9LILI|nr:hypothetical protein J5N97_018982 [Dioscorea zingiberensis]